MMCLSKDCQEEFDPKTHNQKYCSDDCCRVATNKRIMEKYYEKKAIKNGSLRSCKSCSSALSRYNKDNVCSLCTKKASAKNVENFNRIINEIS